MFNYQSEGSDVSIARTNYTIVTNVVTQDDTGKELLVDVVCASGRGEEWGKGGRSIHSWR